MLKTKLRFVYMLATGFAIAILFQLLLPPDAPDHNFLFAAIAIITITIIIWEGNLRIDGWLNARYPWVDATRKRLLLQTIVSSLYTVTSLFVLISIAHLIMDGRVELPGRHRIDPLFVPGLVVAFSVLIIDVGSQFFKAWKKSLVEVEKYKTESAMAQLQNLKNQLNPHFLFNNLSVLASLVHKDQDKAVDFINELSKVYRYVLDNKNAELLTLQEELAFLDHYIYLLKIRFESSIMFSIAIDDNLRSSCLPPMCLQMLVENTIQHNEASRANPLQVSIYTNQHALIVENLLQPRSDVPESSQTGLVNIQTRYSFFTSQKVEIINNGKSFKVVLPLISKG
ncbi:MAG: sensor histidine kinase [Bacteroidales bacterium]